MTGSPASIDTVTVSMHCGQGVGRCWSADIDRGYNLNGRRGTAGYDVSRLCGIELCCCWVLRIDHSSLGPLVERENTHDETFHSPPGYKPNRTQSRP